MPLFKRISVVAGVMLLFCSASAAQSITNARQHAISVRVDSVQVDSLSIIKGTFYMLDESGSYIDTAAYILDEAKLAIVPFYCFGSDPESSWYRLSVGTCKKEEISEMLGALKAALQKLS